MAENGCWGPTCDFTGSRVQSDATPGRCTKTAGYIALAEITEIITGNPGDDFRIFHEEKSDTDVMIYKGTSVQFPFHRVSLIKPGIEIDLIRPLMTSYFTTGDYISYMTPLTKDARRAGWAVWNFAGTVDWAVDLQGFTSEEMNAKPERPESGEGCVSGVARSLDSGDLCEFSCTFGFCPETQCQCRLYGTLEDLPPENTGIEAVAWDSFNVDINRLCKFACRYNYCPQAICTIPLNGPDPTGIVEVGDTPGEFNQTEAMRLNSQTCLLYKNPALRDVSVMQCKPACQEALDEAAEDGRTGNYGCIGFYPLDKSIPWQRSPMRSTELVAPGKCLCDHFVLNELADTVIEALPMIAQVSH
jgi:hypothetical protein